MKSTDTGGEEIPASIVVTGDFIRETHLYQGTRRSASTEATSGFRVETKLGGANLIYELLETVQPGISMLGLEADERVAWPKHLDAQAIYAPFPAGFISDPALPPGKKPEKVWRVTEPLGYGNTGDVPPVEPSMKRRELAKAAHTVLLIDDGGAGFRTLRAKDRWPDGGDATKPLPPWVVLKMSQPLCESHLWRHLVAKCDRQSGNSKSNLVVIVSADELRRDGAAINRGLSWERTISDTCQTLTHNPRFSALKRAEHLVVVFRREGVLWLQKEDRTSSLTPEEQHSATLVFDASLAEAQWKTTLRDGDSDVFGHLSVFTAAITLQLTRYSTPESLDKEEFVAAIQRGLIASRQLRLLGHGPVLKSGTPQFPKKELAEILKLENSTPPIRESHQPQDRFVTVSLPGGVARGSLGLLGNSLPLDWTIASLNDTGGDPIPLYGHGFQTAIYGPSRLCDIPHARFGDLLSVDRNEIETLRSLRQMIQHYEKGGPQKQPLCIGAFGPPGAGKSFGIKQIACEILGKDVPLKEFNLSQFSDPADLIGAFHQVRDLVLSGRTPVVFWDEFDSQHLKWLQYLLAPMQDGKFQSGQVTHLIGKCIFVFAGATSWDFEHFGPAPDPACEVEAAQLRNLIQDSDTFAEARRIGEAEFRLKKGPDFVSRLSGHINVAGPNRRLRFNFATGQWDQPDLTDVTFPVRRALLLRSFLKAKDTDTLDIDRDLLNALLRQPRYRHGARSMEKTVEPLRIQHAALRPAQLPSPQVLAQHLEPVAIFQSLLSENSEFLTQENVGQLAAAIHENFRRLFAKAGTYVADSQFREKFSSLDAWGQGTNLAAARGIPHVLSVAGLSVVSGTASRDETTFVEKRISQFIDALRREEHARWMTYMVSNGWLQAVEKDASGKPNRENGRLLHDCLIPFNDLPAYQQEKDHAAILSLPETVAMVGFKIVLFANVGD